jgi:ADP-heptose:LPS heptosyltransferase
MIENYFVSLQALGDNLISLSLLAQLDKRIKILGTKQTKSIITLMGVEDKFDLLMPFEDIPAFYDIRKRGIFKAIKDIIHFRSYVRKYRIQELVFEKCDWRVRLLTFGLQVNVQSRFYDDNVYVNRKLLIEDVYHSTIYLSEGAESSFPKKIQKVLINPTTRVSSKNIQSDHLRFIIAFLHKNHIEVTLIDFEQNYTDLENKVTHYKAHTTLNDVKSILLETDLYIGADSFLIHYAYYLHKPFFIVFNQENTHFLPPVCTHLENYLMATQGDFEMHLTKKFIAIGILEK